MERLQIPLDAIRRRRAPLSHRDDAAETRWLVDLIVDDEAHFVHVFERLPSERRRCLLSDPHCEQLLRHKVWEFDRLAAAQALRAAYAACQRVPPPPFESEAQLGRRALNTCRPHLALLTVQRRDSTAALSTYLQRFAGVPSCWRLLVERRVISAQRYIDHFGAPPALLCDWLSRELLPAPQAARNLMGEPDTLSKLLRQGDLTADDVLRGTSPQSLRQQWCSWLAQQDFLPSASYLRDQADLRQTLFFLAHAGQLSCRQFLQAVPRPGLRQMRDLLQAGRATHLDCLRSGCLTEADILQHVDAGEWTAEQVIGGGPIPASLAERWLFERRVKLPAFLAGTAEHWLCDMPLPPQHTIFASDQASSTALLTSMPMPTEPGQRAAYATRMLATYLCIPAAGPLPGLAGKVRQALAACPSLGLCDTPQCVGHGNRTSPPCVLECKICDTSTLLQGMQIPARASRPRQTLALTGMWT